MIPLAEKNVLVIGLGKSGLAAAEFLRRRGATVTAVDSARTPALQESSRPLTALGVAVELGLQRAPAHRFDLAVVSPGVAWTNPILAEMQERKVPIVGELELGYQHSLCLNVSITGTNGKTTTTELVERMLTAHHIK